MEQKLHISVETRHIYTGWALLNTSKIFVNISGSTYLRKLWDVSFFHWHWDILKYIFQFFFPLPFFTINVLRPNILHGSRLCSLKRPRSQMTYNDLFLSPPVWGYQIQQKKHEFSSVPHGRIQNDLYEPFEIIVVW